MEEGTEKTDPDVEKNDEGGEEKGGNDDTPMDWGVRFGECALCGGSFMLFLHVQKVHVMKL